MEQEQVITSIQNPKVKRLIQLQQKSSERRAAQRFVVEVARELVHCLEAGYEIAMLFYCPEILTRYEHAAEIMQLARQAECYQVTPRVYERFAYRGSTEGVVAVMKSRSFGLDDIKLSASPLLVILERVEKPGNLGAVLRSADAAAADAVIICDPLTDLYNPNLIRSSIGAVFTVPTVACRSEECIAFLKAHHIQILTAQLQDSKLYYDTDMKQPTAIVMGTESTGLTNVWREAADAHIRIPMLGRLDSLNVSVSAAIQLFEAIRQRDGEH